jgi:predicted nucleic acid-binding protein
MPVEAANILRREAALACDISADLGSLAHTDPLDLRVEFFPYQPCAARVWELRDNVTCYAGWYLAVAELLDAPLATLDGRLANSPGPRCRFLVRPAEI